MLRNLERISRENYKIFVWWKMPKTLDITRILREQKELLRAGFQDRLVMTASISLRNYDALRCIIITEPNENGAASFARRIRFAYRTRRSTSSLVRRRVQVYSPQAKYPSVNTMNLCIDTIMMHFVASFIARSYWIIHQSGDFVNCFFKNGNPISNKSNIPPDKNILVG